MSFQKFCLIILISTILLASAMAGLTVTHRFHQSEIHSREEWLTFTYQSISPMLNLPLIRHAPFTAISGRNNIMVLDTLPEFQVERTLNFPDGGFATWGDEEPYILYIPLQEEFYKDYYFVVSIPQSRIITQLRQEMYLAMFSVISIFTIAIIIATLFLRYASKELKKTVLAIHAVSKGDYSAELKPTFFKELSLVNESIAHMRDTVEFQFQELESKNAETLQLVLKTLDTTDAYTHGHSNRVAEISEKMAVQIHYPHRKILYEAALTHDIGKISIPESILRKPGKLTEDEFKLMREHPTRGYHILTQSSTFKGVDVLVKHHHERFDGKGYPDGLKGDAIPLGSQILSIADVYDALTTDRPYRAALSPDEAKHIMTHEMKTHFNPYLLEEFLKIPL